MPNEIPMDPGLFGVALSGAEQEFLTRALAIWDGVAYPSSAFMTSLGFEDGRSLVESAQSLEERILRSEPLSRTEWTVALLLSEVGFASDIQGGGLEWEGYSGIPDRETIALLRSVQMKLIDIRLRFKRHSGDQVG